MLSFPGTILIWEFVGLEFGKGGFIFWGMGPTLGLFTGVTSFSSFILGLVSVGALTLGLLPVSILTLGLVSDWCLALGVYVSGFYTYILSWFSFVF